jgi:3-oxoacyl-[acyl-carrier-protein] synthase II
MGVITPIGMEIDSFWNALITGRAGSGPVRSFDTSTLKSGVGCEVGNFELPGSLRPFVRGGRCTELALLAAKQAVEAAEIEPEIRAHSDVAVIVGTTMGDVTRFEQDRASHRDRQASEEELASLVYRSLDVMGRSIADAYHLSGPLTTVPTACAAGAYAIGMAASLVARGRVRAAIAVGCEAFSRLAFIGFTRLGAMSPDVCRPFSRGRRGLLLGEGAAAVVLESEESARERGVEPVAFIDGFGLSCDAYHITGPQPEGVGAARAMENALKDAVVPVDRIDYVNAHGTGTSLNDKMESLAIRRVFSGRSPEIPVSSIKALTGHLMGAAGAVEAVASLLALRYQVIPPTWNWEEPDPECAVDCVPNEPRPARLRHVLSNSYAFGGNNASLLLSSPFAGQA